MKMKKSGDHAGDGPPRPAGDAPASSLDAVLQGALGKKLRDSYQEVVNEEVPDKFMVLLRELKKRESDSGDRKS